MKPITIAICDENSRDAGVLEEYVRKLLPDAEITKLTKSHQLLNRMTENPNQFQLIFMEIEFEEENGIWVAQEIRKVNKKVGIIFMTKSEKYYRQAFDVFALQYLLKPLTYEKIEKIFYFLDSNVQRYNDRSMEERSVCFSLSFPVFIRSDTVRSSIFQAVFTQ